jgi:hypothetical protein
MKWDLETLNDKFQNLRGTNGWKKLKVWWVLGDAKISLLFVFKGGEH